MNNNESRVSLVRDLKIGDKVLTDKGVMIVTQDAKKTWHPTDENGGTWFAKADPTGFYADGTPVNEDILNYAGRNNWTIQGNDLRHIVHV